MAFKYDTICTLPPMKFFSEFDMDILPIYKDFTYVSDFSFMFHELNAAILSNASTFDTRYLHMPSLSMPYTILTPVLDTALILGVPSYYIILYSVHIVL